MFEVIRGEYPRLASRAKPVAVKGKRLRIKLGWPKNYFFDLVDPEVQTAIDAAVKLLDSMGARAEEVSLPHLEESVEASTKIGLAEATSYHRSRGYFPARATDYSEDVQRRLKLQRPLRHHALARAQPGAFLAALRLDAHVGGVPAATHNDHASLPEDQLAGIALHEDAGDASVLDQGAPISSGRSALGAVRSSSQSAAAAREPRVTAWPSTSLIVAARPNQWFDSLWVFPT